MGLMEHHNLIAGPPATYLPEDTEATAELAAGDDPSAVAARDPTFLAAWAAPPRGRGVEGGRPVPPLRVPGSRLPRGPRWVARGGRGGQRADPVGARA